MSNEKYFKRAWGLLTRDKGWIKPVLVMTAANLVPVAGALGNSGYALEWARLTAWGVDSSPKQKNVNVTGCIASGWRAFLVALGWGAAVGIMSAVIRMVADIFPGILGDALGVLAAIASIAISLIGSAFLTVAQLRAAIYEKAAAGYAPDRVLEMVRKDTKGFVGIILINVACAAVMSLAAALLAVILTLELTPALVIASGSTMVSQVAEAIASTFWILALTIAVFGSVIGFLGTLVRLITTQVAALWMRQFDVAHWGRSEEPLPQSSQM